MSVKYGAMADDKTRLELKVYSIFIGLEIKAVVKVSYDHLLGLFNSELVCNNRGKLL